ncbi:MAG: Gfo/Idh/MocA family oxidoreductase [Verrucomicrobia bacterium]|nr:Gfo/Idh/MocA family oxidoreductase [Verrucomicrobiota bacterium]
MNKQTRRSFLKRMAGAGALLAFPTIIPSHVLGGESAPSNRIVMGTIGTGGRGKGVMKIFLGNAGLQMVAVCDVDRDRREGAKEMVDKQYNNTDCAQYGDFRELLARPDIDTVLIGTPDHWHALNVIAACKAGKDIYCEKPFAASIAEGRAAADAVKRYGRVLQVGSHERSRYPCRYACELVQNGFLGRLHTVTVNLPTDRRTCPPQPVEPVPAGFDYDMWLGPAPYEPYTTKRCHTTFRFIQDYTPGELIDRGAHVGDLAQWGNGTMFSGPLEIEGKGEFPEDGLFDTAIGYDIHGRYASGVKLRITDKEPRGVKFEGDEGWVFIHVHGGNLEASPSSLIRLPIPSTGVQLYDNTNDHQQNFLNCVRTRNQPIAPAESGHRTSSLCHMANIALLLGRKLRWNPETERFIGDPQADAMIARPMRAPWTLDCV